MSRLRSRRLIQAAVYGKGSGGGGFTPSSTQSGNFLNRVAAVTGVGSPTYGLTTTERNAYDTMITGIVSVLGGSTSSSTWPIFDAFYILATTSVGVAALNLIGSSYSIVTHGSPSFAQDHGYTGIAAAYLDTQLIPVNTGATKFVEDDCSVWVWTLTNIAAGVDYGPALQDDTDIRVYPQYSNGHFYVSLNSGSEDYAPASVGHFYGASRNVSTGFTAYVDTAPTPFAGLSSLTLSVGPLHTARCRQYLKGRARLSRRTRTASRIRQFLSRAHSKGSSTPDSTNSCKTWRERHGSRP